MDIKLLTLYSIDTHFDASTTAIFENIVGKGEIATLQAVSPFPTMFSTQSDNCIPICPYSDIISLVAFELEELKSVISGKGFKKKKKKIGQKTWLLWETHFPLYGIK